MRLENPIDEVSSWVEVRMKLKLRDSQLLEAEVERWRQELTTCVDDEEKEGEKAILFRVAPDVGLKKELGVVHVS
jgi:hypothetical protein